jgi:hypothetical protein
VLQGTRTCLLASSPRINAVDHWTLGGIADPLKNRCLPRICSSNNEDSELDVHWESGEVLLCIHRVEVRKIEGQLGLQTREIARSYYTCTNMAQIPNPIICQ